MNLIELSFDAAAMINVPRAPYTELFCQSGTYVAKVT